MAWFKCIGTGSEPTVQEKIAEWDFTSESLVDSVNGYILANHNGILSSNGLSFETNSAYVDIPLDLLGIGRTYEIEFGEMDCEYSSNNNRVFGYRYYSNDSQSYSNQGLYYRGAASLWCVYDDTNGVQASNISDPDFFSNSTMKIEIGMDGKWKIYKNGELVFAPPSALPITPRIFNLGSEQYPFYNMVIKKFRVMAIGGGEVPGPKVTPIWWAARSGYDAYFTAPVSGLYLLQASCGYQGTANITLPSGKTPIINETIPCVSGETTLCLRAV